MRAAGLPLGAVAGFTVGIVGVGNMGGAMAQRLCHLGWAPWVHDVDVSKLHALVHLGAKAVF